MLLGPNPVLTEGDVYAVSTTPKARVGAVVTDIYGDRYRYVKAGEALSAGYLAVSPAPLTTAIHNVDVNTAAIGDKTVTVTAGAEAVAADQLSGGVLTVNSGTAIGDSYPIIGNDAISASGGAMIVRLGAPIHTAFGASDKVTISINPANGVLHDTSSTLQPVGICVNDIASGSFGWVKTWGVIGALADETITLGAWVTSGTSTAGAVEEMDDVTAPVTDNLVGYAVVAGVDAEVRPIFVTIQ